MSAAINIQAMRWTKLNQKGEYTSRCQNGRPGAKGVWKCSITIPYTESQGTLEYYAWDGIVMLPTVCWHGHDRAKFHQKVIRETRLF